ncbi:MAG: c-type cytochrome biogenesis protein CcsB [Candidatus Melainabacteria bacterium]|nr:c-type cytochrome biogenesis protein CcsB [Candidatus Melainabacteria bacterium]
MLPLETSTLVFWQDERFWLHGGLILLVLAVFAYVLRLLFAQRPLAHGAAWWLLLLSAVAFSTSIACRSAEAGYFALSNMYESLLVLSIATQCLFLWLDRTFRLPAMGWPVSLLVLATVAYATTLPTNIQPLQAALQSYWRSIHVPVILSAYAMFTLAFISSLLLLVQSWREQGAPSHRANGQQNIHAASQGLPSFGLPLLATGPEAAGGSGALSLVSLYDEVTYRCVTLGFPLLTIGIILGGLWANEAWGNYWSWDPKESMSLVTLLGYGVYLHLRVNGEHRPQTLAWVSVAGFVLMLVTYFGVNLMGVGLHSYGKIG